MTKQAYLWRESGLKRLRLIKEEEEAHVLSLTALIIGTILLLAISVG